MRKVINIKYVDSRLIPIREHPTDAGADLRSTGSHTLYPGDMQMIDTGVSIAIPEGYVGLVYPRSSMGKVRVSLANTVGVIDSDYRGVIKVLLVNEGENPYYITAYDTKVAQLVVTPIVLAQFSRWEGTDEQWVGTSRGVGGFGSTG